MVGGMCGDVRDGTVPGLQFCIVGLLDGFLPFFHYLSQFLNGRGPRSFREIVEGLVVVAVEFIRRPSIKFIQRLFIPEPDMIGQLSDGMAGVVGFPHGLFGGDAFDAFHDRDEPVGLIVGCAKLLEQDGFECRRGFLLRRLLCGQVRREQEEAGGKDDSDL